MVFLGLWLVCNHYTHRVHSARSYNKVLTALLAFKVVSVYSAYAKYTLCAISADSYLILKILHNASYAVYESLFLGTLCVLSCGLFLVSGALPMSRIRFLSLFISVLYLLVSAENLLSIRNKAFVMGLEAGVWSVCLVMSFLTYRTLSQLLHETYILHLDSFRLVLQRKRTYFLSSFWVIQAYFLLKVLFHLYLRSISILLTANRSSQLSIFIFSHEILELCTSIAVFTLYLQATETPAVDFRLIRVSSCLELPLFVSEGVINVGEVEADMDWQRPLLVLAPGREVIMGFLEQGSGEMGPSY